MSAASEAGGSTQRPCSFFPFGKHLSASFFFEPRAKTLRVPRRGRDRARVPLSVAYAPATYRYRISRSKPVAGSSPHQASCLARATCHVHGETASVCTSASSAPCSTAECSLGMPDRGSFGASDRTHNPIKTHIPLPLPCLLIAVHGSWMIVGTRNARGGCRDLTPRPSRAVSPLESTGLPAVGRAGQRCMAYG